jgi:hypothetical protein
MMNLEPDDFRRTESIAKEGDLDCIFCCATLLAILPHHGQLRKNAPNGPWMHVPIHRVSVTDQSTHDDTTGSSSSVLTKQNPSSKSSKSKRKKKRHNKSGADSTDDREADQSGALTGYTDHSTQTDPVPSSFSATDINNSTLMKPMMLAEVVPTSALGGPGTSTKPDDCQSMSTDSASLIWAQELVASSKQIGDLAADLALHNRHLALQNQQLSDIHYSDANRITSLQRENQSLHQYNMIFVESHEHNMHSVQSLSAENAR